ncbi:hypothetical protein HHK36_003633 [Tetracentron sinense]|uniref:Seipin n=1 Tax=Tetracentron sinense TaxID=13715 RepID=A0A835DSC4_TETSI|nr:hypothetical protein HHK36_003633 [Tetracentron sinense]
MAETNIRDNHNVGIDQFVDALDEFLFLDSKDTSKSGESVELSAVSGVESVEDGDSEVVKATNSSETPFPSGLRRRSSFRYGRQNSENSQVHDGTARKQRRNRISCALKENKKVCEIPDFSSFRLSSDRNGSINEDIHENSTITSATKEHVDDSGTVDSPLGDLDESPSNFLVFLAGLVIKTIGFQFNLLISFFTFPISMLHFYFLFVMDPFQTTRQAKDYLREKLLNIGENFSKSVTPWIYEQLKGQKSIGKLAMRFGWGFLVSVYVCFMLVGFLVLAFIIGGFITRYLVEEPIQKTESLNFDYTKPSPVAFVPIMSCPSVFHGVRWEENVQVGRHVGSRVIPPNQKLHLTISLELPESEYNRKLGVFQIRIDFLSADGKVTASSWHPCMLRFKSQPICFLETFLKIVPLVVGYSSESQILNLKMKDFTEGNEPTSCLKVTLEQRAEYMHGAGIPEIYAASIVLESELPLFKRIIWSWKNTILIWTSMMLFMMELMLILVCCTPIIIPRARPGDGLVNIKSLGKKMAPGLKADEPVDLMDFLKQVEKVLA